MDRRDFLTASASALAVAGGLPLRSSTPMSDAAEPPPFDHHAAREVVIHTTADGTDHRLTRTGTAAFVPYMASCLQAITFSSGSAERSCLINCSSDAGLGNGRDI